MSVLFIAVVLAVGGGGWFFFQLNTRPGDAHSATNFVGAFIAGLVVFAFVFTLLIFVLHIE